MYYLIVTGVLFAALGMKICIQDAVRARRCRRTATATVCEIHRHVRGRRLEGRRRYVSYVPTFRFKACGQYVTRVSKYGYRKNTYRPGQKITVRYNPNDPSDFYRAPDGAGPGAACIMLACIFFAMAAAVYHAG